MSRIRKRLALAVTGIVGIVVLVTGSAPLPSLGADHLDAPGLMSPSGRSQADINDLYAFAGSNAANTVLALTTNPGVGPISPSSYGSDVLYEIKIYQNGDAVEDLAYKVMFSGVRGDGTQHVIVKRAVGSMARGHNAGGMPVAIGGTGKTLSVAGGGSFFAGVRSDPFFFDLDAFLGTIGFVANGRSFNDGNENDFFEELNTLGMVLEVPDSALGTNIGVFATTSIRDSNGNWVQADRMGRPAINTVFNTTALGGHTADKNLFNTTLPPTDPANFTGNVVGVLQALSSMDTEGAYTTDQKNFLASILLPDLLRYDTSTPAAGPLNGRGLRDDVIDVELNIVTGGYPFTAPHRNDVGKIPGDGVDAHTDYLSVFPYLGMPHSS